MLYPATYLRFEGCRGGQLPNGKSWVKVDLERALKSSGWTPRISAWSVAC